MVGAISWAQLLVGMSCISGWRDLVGNGCLGCSVGLFLSVGKIRREGLTLAVAVGARGQAGGWSDVRMVLSWSCIMS